MKKSIAARLVQSNLAKGLVVAASVVAGSAHAAIDTTTVTTALTEAGAAIAVVGAAYLAMSVGAKVFKWIKTAL